MKTEIGLDRLERESYMAYYRDGILDFLVGFALLGMSLCIMLGDAGMGALLPVIAILLHPGLKKYVTLPRLGYVKFTPRREEQLKANRWQLTVLFTVTAVVGVAVSLAYSGDSNWQLWIKSLGAIPVGAVLAATAAALGTLYGVRRGLVYALVILVVFALGHVLRIHISKQLLFLGAMLTIIGIALFLRFVKRYPKLSQESADDA